MERMFDFLRRQNINKSQPSQCNSNNDISALADTTSTFKAPVLEDRVQHKMDIKFCFNNDKQERDFTEILYNISDTRMSYCAS